MPTPNHASASVLTTVVTKRSHTYECRTAGQFSDVGFSLENISSNFSWAFRTLENKEGFVASKQGTGGKEFEVRNATTNAANVGLYLANGGQNVTGAWETASSRSYKKNIRDLTSDDAMQALRELKSVKYQYKRDKNDTPMVGFIAKEVMFPSYSPPTAVKHWTR